MPLKCSDEETLPRRPLLDIIRFDLLVCEFESGFIIEGHCSYNFAHADSVTPESSGLKKSRGGHEAIRCHCESSFLRAVPEQISECFAHLFFLPVVRQSFDAAVVHGILILSRHVAKLL